ncbi:hypothetical protein LXL04_013906 [Taraxacum kok-saghyz]
MQYSPEARLFHLRLLSSAVSSKLRVLLTLPMFGNKLKSMHEYNSLDLNRYLQFGIITFAILFGLILLVKNTASKYFVVDGDDDARFDSHPQSSSPAAPSDSGVSPSSSSMPGIVATSDLCVVCGSLTKKHCSRCKGVRYWYIRTVAICFLVTSQFFRKI